MEKARSHYWQRRLKNIKEALEKNGFDVYLADDTAQARRVVEEEILPGVNPGSVAWGGSMTFLSTGIYESIKERTDWDVVDTFEKGLREEEKLDRRRRALFVDLFITGTNAVTEKGQLVNLDMYGNRVAAITFGPRYVLILLGRNKLVADLEGAMARIKDYAAPINAMRLDKKTPCAQTSFCEECTSPDRICNTWIITEKSFPPKRVKVVLIDQDLGI